MNDQFDNQHQQYLEDGWCLFDRDPDLDQWIERSLPAAKLAVTARENRKWFRHGDTWFVGVNALDNDESGRIKDGIPITGAAARFLREKISADLDALDRAQVSVCYPGYPQPSDDEPETAFGYRLRRDAAHVDGLLKKGESRRRFLKEFHHYIFGIQMSQSSANAAPLVFWRGSHHIIRKAFTKAFSDRPSNQWHLVDVTDTYQKTRREIFENCERVEIPLRKGQSIVGHRLSLHGTAPWSDSATAEDIGRMICFFRPGNLSANEWLELT